MDKNWKRFLPVGAVLLLAVIYIDRNIIADRIGLWRPEGTRNKVVLDFFENYHGDQRNNCQIALIGFPGSRVFMEDLIPQLMNVKATKIIQNVAIKVLEDFDISDNFNNSYLFI